MSRELEGIPRDSYVLSTKFPYSKNDTVRPAEDLEKNADECLKELKTDYIDIYHLHGVRHEFYAEVRDRFYPELVRMREKGKIRFVGKKFVELK